MISTITNLVYELFHELPNDLRLSHLPKISPWGEIFNFCQGWKKLLSHLSFNPGRNQSPHPIHPTRGENTPGKIRGIKNATWKKTLRMQLQDIKTMMLDSINKRSKMFNFKAFKIVLLAISNNSEIVADSL